MNINELPELKMEEKVTSILGLRGNSQNPWNYQTSLTYWIWMIYKVTLLRPAWSLRSLRFSGLWKSFSRLLGAASNIRKPQRPRCPQDILSNPRILTFQCYSAAFEQFITGFWNSNFLVVLPTDYYSFILTGGQIWTNIDSFTKDMSKLIVLRIFLHFI